jgi:hypothetical protein
MKVKINGFKVYFKNPFEIDINAGELTLSQAVNIEFDDDDYLHNLIRDNFYSLQVDYDVATEVPE